jgi:hypothetical protein
MQQSPTNATASAGAVYVQTNAAPNEVIAFRRADDGDGPLLALPEEQVRRAVRAEFGVDVVH